VKTLIYSLRTINDKSELSIDLTRFVVSENLYTLHLKLPSGEIFIDKKEYLNKMKIFDDGEVFFIVCGYKLVSRDSAKQCLMNHAINKVDQTLESLNTRVAKLEKFKTRLQTEIAA
jgi:hypothetical protein